MIDERLVEYRTLRDRAYQNYANLEGLLRSKGMSVTLYCRTEDEFSAPTAEFYVNADLEEVQNMCTRDLDKYEFGFDRVERNRKVEDKELSDYFVFTGIEPETRGKIIIHYGRHISHDTSAPNRRLTIEDMKKLEPANKDDLRLVKKN